MRQFLPAMTDAIWHFAKAKNPLPERSASAKATRKLQARMTRRGAQFEYQGHQLAQR